MSKSITLSLETANNLAEFLRSQLEKKVTSSPEQVVAEIVKESAAKHKIPFNRLKYIAQTLSQEVAVNEFLLTMDGELLPTEDDENRNDIKNDLESRRRANGNL